MRTLMRIEVFEMRTKSKAQERRTEKASKLFELAQAKFKGKDEFTAFLCYSYGAMSCHISDSTIKSIAEMIERGKP